MDNYFVMLNSQSGKSIMPLIDEDEYVCLYDTFDEAKTAAENNIMGENFGYEIFLCGNGE